MRLIDIVDLKRAVGHPVTIAILLLFSNRNLTVQASTIGDITSSLSAPEKAGTCANLSALRKQHPYVSPMLWLPRIVQDIHYHDMAYKDVIVHLGVSNDDQQTCDNTGFPTLLPVTIGSMPEFTTDQALHVLDVAVNEGWNGGLGTWPQMSLQQRITAIENFLNKLMLVRNDIIDVLQWEIGKNTKDATAEFDRTIQFAKQVIDTIKNDPAIAGGSTWTASGNTQLFTRRGAVGVIMCLAPYNYPLNESYAAIIPALLMGNIIVLKIPTIGGLAHLLTMQAFQESLPPNTINFIAGAGRKTMPPLMETGLIDGLAFIGSKNAANQLIHIHPNPHRLKVFLQLEAKNMGIFLSNLFENDAVNALDHALNEAILGTLSFNGQRCTALKLLFVPTEHANTMIEKLVNKIQQLNIGLPWQLHPNDDGSMSYSNVTPLPTLDRVKYMKELLQDALDKGASIMNPNGGTIIGGDDVSTLMIPAVLYPVTPDMKVYEEEQFGPLIPIAPYDTLNTVIEYGQRGLYGQQVSIFVDPAIQSNNPDVTKLLDSFANIFGKININMQCGRSPDTVAFSGRRSSAMGTMSVKDALLEFSIPTVVSYHQSKPDDLTLTHIQEKSVFLHPLTETTATTK